MFVSQYGGHIPENYDELVSLTIFHWMKTRSDDVVDMALDRLFTPQFGSELVRRAGKSEDDFICECLDEILLLRRGWRV